jgi:hypothetical protein
MNYQDLYERWDEFEDVRFTIPGETMWAKQLPDGALGLNNNPLDPKYRWQDVVIDGEVVHRRWTTRIEYRYKHLADKTQDLKQREALYEALKPLGSPSFFMPGMGFLLSEEAVPVVHERMESTLTELGIDFIVQPVWSAMGLPGPIES